MPGRARDLQTAGRTLWMDPWPTSTRPGMSPSKYLEGKVKAARFVAGEEFEIADGLAPLREGPSSDALLVSQALKGERVTIYDRNSGKVFLT